MSKKTRNMILLICAVVGFGAFATSNLTYASSADDACASELCLSDYETATEHAQTCNEPINNYFKIKKKKHGDFSASRTYRERRKYLYKCRSGNRQVKEEIMARYGYLPSKP
ncbi:TrbM protein [Malonomonas rubra DSM 5091]|uniref:TrbM protein n=1 Tax=Malonomonas rubra DSM 5091 TaxID=1122189 RepID=A0A1M6KT76_MALRU|nr:TrbM/KikA/MpfK family conjugal transfer protein [Malonomonas rubra]SHJ62167.1 TrbM protein [Malonomonas rubra DSM 5091]